MSHLTAKLDCIQATGVPALDLTWLNNNLQKALARHAAQASVQRLRLLDAPQRYTVLVCFLTQTYHETLDPTFKGVWSAAANFAPLPPLDTRPGQYPQHHKRSDGSPGCHELGG